MMGGPVEIEINMGEPAYGEGNFVYVWIEGENGPFYVGETGKGIADRCGLHIRDPSRSGAIVATWIRKRARRRYLVLGFKIEQDLWQRVAKENGASISRADCNRARKAIERKVYDVLKQTFPGMHKGRNCKWRAESAREFAENILKQCRERS